MPEEWLKDLVPLQTDWKKSFLETALWLIMVFKKSYGLDEEGKKSTNYYVSESTGIATGFFNCRNTCSRLVHARSYPKPHEFFIETIKPPIQ